MDNFILQTTKQTITIYHLKITLHVYTIMKNYQYASLLQIYQNNKEDIEEIKLQYLRLLSLLTITPEITNEEFIEQIHEISKIGTIRICYYIDLDNKLHIVGSGTIIYEPKIIHGCKKVGHIEDIVVHPDARSNGIAKNIIEQLVYLARENNCYKVILDCATELTRFYEKNGFQCKGNQMSKYFIQ